MPLDPKILDDLSSRISRLLPPSARELRQDMEKNLKAALSAAFAKLDLVTREELEIQSAVLQRSRERLIALEQRVAQLEAAAHSPDHAAASNAAATPPTPLTPGH